MRFPWWFCDFLGDSLSTQEFWGSLRITNHFLFFYPIFNCLDACQWWAKWAVKMNVFFSMGKMSKALTPQKSTRSLSFYEWVCQWKTNHRKKESSFPTINFSMDKLLVFGGVESNNIYWERWLHALTACFYTIVFCRVVLPQQNARSFTLRWSNRSMCHGHYFCAIRWSGITVWATGNDLSHRPVSVRFACPGSRSRPNELPIGRESFSYMDHPKDHFVWPTGLPGFGELPQNDSCSLFFIVADEGLIWCLWRTCLNCEVIKL